MKIIDAHAHVCEYLNGFGASGELRALGDGCAQYLNDKPFRIIPKGMGEYGCSPEALLAVMDSNNVERAVLLQGNYLGQQNLYTALAVKKYPKRFIGAASLDPFYRNYEMIIKYLFDDLNFRIIKMELSTTSGLMCNHETINLNGKIMHQLYQMASNKGLTFVIDIGRPNSDSFQVDNLVNAIKEYPKMNFVICHLGSHQINQLALLEDTINKLNLPNVYFDLASVANNVKPEEYPYKTALSYILKAKEIVGINKLMWGSDMPAGIVRDSYQHMISYIMESKQFTNQELEAIFYHNAKRIYWRE